VNESPNEFDVGTASKSGTTKRNRFASWESTSQRSTKSGARIRSSKITTSSSPLIVSSKITKSLVAALLWVLYTFFIVAYEVAKFVTRGLSSIRRLWFVAE
jgi:hypothetical protein